VKPTFRMKCPSLRLRTPPPAQCTMNASRMMARIATTTQKKNMTMPGTTIPAMVLALVATAASYPLKKTVFAASECEQAAIPVGLDAGPPSASHRDFQNVGGPASRSAEPDLQVGFGG
jgi:hypothetical protein